MAIAIDIQKGTIHIKCPSKTKTWYPIIYLWNWIDNKEVTINESLVYIPINYSYLWSWSLYNKISSKQRFG